MEGDGAGRGRIAQGGCCRDLQEYVSKPRVSVCVCVVGVGVGEARLKAA